MKAVWIALVLLIVSVALVIANSALLGGMFDKIYNDISSVDLTDTTAAGEKYQEIYDYYNKYVSFIALSVKHSELKTIEQSFCELISACNSGALSDAALVKSRLIGEISHTRRLIGFNIDSIF